MFFLLTITAKRTCEIERPNTKLLDCISDTVSLWIQAFYQALHIGAFLGSVSEIRPAKEPYMFDCTASATAPQALLNTTKVPSQVACQPQG